MKKSKFTVTITLLVINVISLLLASYAWFFILNPNSKLDNIQVFAGDYTYVSLNPETGYKPTLDFGDIVDGELITGQHLIPVTSKDGFNFYKKYGGYYSHPPEVMARSFFDFDIYLKSTVDRDIYLGVGSGFSATVDSNLANALRVSLTTYTDDENRIIEKSIIWEPDNDGLGSYGEGVYDLNYPYIDDPNFLCFIPGVTEGYLLCPTEEDKAYYHARAYTNEELMVPVFGVDEDEDLSDIPVIISLDGGKELGRLLTIRIWIEGYDPDCNVVMELSEDGLQIKIDFSMSLFFAGREVESGD